MREYVKPTFEIAELRLEERMACCSTNRKIGHIYKNYTNGRWKKPCKHKCSYVGRGS